MGKLTQIRHQVNHLGWTGFPVHLELQPGTIMRGLMIVGLLSLPAAAQSATNFNTREVSPATPPVATPAKPAVKDDKKIAAAVTATPSRYVNEEDVDAYVNSLASVFSMRNRQSDPFGQLQDPDARPIVKATPNKPKTRQTQVQAFPFSDIIRLIKVTTIMPGEKRFLVGTRSIKEGDSIPLSFRGRSYKVVVAGVTSRSIEFRNSESGEVAALTLNLLPVGMTPGNGKITAPGMVPENAGAPLELDSHDISSPETPLNP